MLVEEEYCPLCDRIMPIRLHLEARLGFIARCKRCNAETEPQTAGASYTPGADWTNGPAGAVVGEREWHGNCKPRDAYTLGRRADETGTVVPWGTCSVVEEDRCLKAGRREVLGVRLCREHHARYLFHAAQSIATGQGMAKSGTQVLLWAVRAMKEAPLKQRTLVTMEALLEAA
jgi:hypothetical protein